LLNILQNGFNSIRKAAPPEKPEPELFLEEPEPYQTDPNRRKHNFGLKNLRTPDSPTRRFSLN
jgi:hypothetical protein